MSQTNRDARGLFVRTGQSCLCGECGQILHRRQFVSIQKHQDSCPVRSSRAGDSGCPAQTQGDDASRLNPVVCFQDLPTAAMATMGAFLCAPADSRYVPARTQDNVPPSPPPSRFLAPLRECRFRDVDMSSGNFSLDKIQMISVLIFNDNNSRLIRGGGGGENQEEG